MITDGTDVAQEKDALLASFFLWAEAVCAFIDAACQGISGVWADFIDPITGYPHRGDRANCTYNEVQGMQALLRYSTQVKRLVHHDCHGRITLSTCIVSTLVTYAASWRRPRRVSRDPSSPLGHILVPSHALHHGSSRRSPESTRGGHCQAFRSEARCNPSFMTTAQVAISVSSSTVASLRRTLRVGPARAGTAAVGFQSSSSPVEDAGTQDRHHVRPSA